MIAQGKLFHAWCREIGISLSTGKRWRKLGMVEVSPNIMGHYWISHEQDKTFWDRATAGAFAKEITAVCEAGELDQASPLVAAPPRRRRKGRVAR